MTKSSYLRIKKRVKEGSSEGHEEGRSQEIKIDKFSSPLDFFKLCFIIKEKL